MAKRYNKNKGVEKSAEPIPTDAPFNDDIQKSILDWLGMEFPVAKRNMEPFHQAFREFDDMIHCRRDKKNDYEPDIYLPEFTSRLLAQIGNFISQLFSSRDFVDTHVNSEDPIDVAEGRASKKLLNTILGEKDAHYFHKLCRLLMFVNPGGFGIIKGDYDQRIERVIAGYNAVMDYSRDDEGNILAEDGTMYVDPYMQAPAKTQTQVPVYTNKVVKDRPIFDVYPVTNVYYDQKYAYTLQDKQYIYFEGEHTVDDLKRDAARFGYFNLKRLEAREKPPDADEQNKPHSVDKKAEESTVRVSPTYKILERWGTWYMVPNKDEEGNITGYSPGIDENGEIMDNAEHIQAIITYAAEGTENTPIELMRFQKSPHSKIPAARFLCYVDAVKDSGFGDGETSKELQIAANDSFNLSAYRTEMATKLAFKAKRWAGIDENIKLRPDKAIMCENVEDLQEFKIMDDIQGGMYQLNTVSSRMDDVMATGSNFRGMPSDRRETATVGAIMDRRADIRMSLKTSTLEWIGFAEFYDMLLTLCNDFMLPQTLFDIIGKDAYYYNPKREDKFQPVSQALETEESKNFKVKMWDQILGRIVMLPNPKTPMIVNYILGQVLELMGGDFKHMKRFMFEENVEANMLYMLATGGKAGQGATGNAPGGPGQAQNQLALPQGGAEQMVRGLM
jgi:hypothetical protein